MEKITFVLLSMACGVFGVVVGYLIGLSNGSCDQKEYVKALEQKLDAQNDLIESQRFLIGEQQKFIENQEEVECKLKGQINLLHALTRLPQ